MMYHNYFTYFLIITYIYYSKIFDHEIFKLIFFLIKNIYEYHLLNYLHNVFRPLNFLFKKNSLLIKIDDNTYNG